MEEEEAATAPPVTCPESRGAVVSFSPPEPPFVMESAMRIKKLLRTPIRKLIGCVTGAREKRLCATRRRKRGRGHGDASVFWKPPPCRGPKPREPSVVLSYRADLEKERQANAKQEEKVNIKQLINTVLAGV